MTTQWSGGSGDLDPGFLALNPVCVSQFYSALKKTEKKKKKEAEGIVRRYYYKN